MSADRQVVVITGGSGGIGEELAIQLAKTGKYTLALLARREEALNAVVAKVGGPDVAKAYVCDVTNRELVNSTVAKVIADFGHIDIFVNNAGRGISRVPSLLTDEDIDSMMNINVKSVLYCMQAVLPHFIERKAGHVVQVSSIAGRVTWTAPRAAYCGSKHFLNSLTDAFRLEIKDKGFADQITVSNFSPGIVKTEFGVNCEGTDNFDSRQVATAQTVEEVVQILIERGIVNREREIYSKDEHRVQIAEYYASM